MYSATSCHSTAVDAAQQHQLIVPATPVCHAWSSSTLFGSQTAGNRCDISLLSTLKIIEKSKGSSDELEKGIGTTGDKF